jgi:hypothetical protein
MFLDDSVSATTAACRRNVNVELAKIFCKFGESGRTASLEGSDPIEYLEQDHTKTPEVYFDPMAMRLCELFGCHVLWSPTAHTTFNVPVWLSINL